MPTDFAERLEQLKAERAQRIASVPETINGRSLTERQREVLAMLMEGLSSREVCVELGLQTLKSHRRNMLVSTRAKSILQLAVWAARATPSLVEHEGPLPALEAAALPELDVVLRHAASELADHSPPSWSPVGDKLTDREREIVALLIDGLRMGTIASRLGISVETVRTYLRTARVKTKARNQTHLVALVVRDEMVELDRRHDPLEEAVLRLEDQVAARRERATFALIEGGDDA